MGEEQAAAAAPEPAAGAAETGGEADKKSCWVEPNENFSYTMEQLFEHKPIFPPKNHLKQKWEQPCEVSSFGHTNKPRFVESVPTLRRTLTPSCLNKKKGCRAGKYWLVDTERYWGHNSLIKECSAPGLNPEKMKRGILPDTELEKKPVWKPVMRTFVNKPERWPDLQNAINSTYGGEPPELHAPPAPPTTHKSHVNNMDVAMRKPVFPPKTKPPPSDLYEGLRPRSSQSGYRMSISADGRTVRRKKVESEHFPSRPTTSMSAMRPGTRGNSIPAGSIRGSSTHDSVIAVESSMAESLQWHNATDTIRNWRPQRVRPHTCAGPNVRLRKRMEQTTPSLAPYSDLQPVLHGEALYTKPAHHRATFPEEDMFGRHRSSPWADFPPTIQDVQGAYVDPSAPGVALPWAQPRAAQLPGGMHKTASGMRWRPKLDPSVESDALLKRRLNAVQWVDGQEAMQTSQVLVQLAEEYWQVRRFITAQTMFEQAYLVRAEYLGAEHMATIDLEEKLSCIKLQLETMASAGRHLNTSASAQSNLGALYAAHPTYISTARRRMAAWTGAAKRPHKADDPNCLCDSCCEVTACVVKTAKSAKRATAAAGATTSKTNPPAEVPAQDAAATKVEDSADSAAAEGQIPAEAGSGGGVELPGIKA